MVEQLEELRQTVNALGAASVLQKAAIAEQALEQALALLEQIVYIIEEGA